VKRVRVVAHIIVPPDTTALIPDTVDGRYKYMGLTNDASVKYRQLQPMHLPTSSALIPDGRVAFELRYEHVLYHARTKWDFSDHTALGQRVRAVEQLHRELVVDNPACPHREDALHVFFLERSQSANRSKFQGVASGIADKHWVLMMDVWHEVQHGGWPSGLLAHEFGHSLGLHHTTSKQGPVNDYCDDTPTHPINTDCWDAPGCSNNIMDYNVFHNALTACQLGRIHAALAGKVGNIHEAVIPDWCSYDSSATIYIARDSSYDWRGERRLAGDLVLLPGSTLRLHCALHLPPGGRVVVMPRARLELQGAATITNTCGPGVQWDGVVLRRRNRRHAGQLYIAPDVVQPLVHCRKPIPQQEKTHVR
jgi:hypothetical protein